mmetsp:Transcript_9815/g.19328  ORF Transcript_9815/g.19328 Transcript_9815/m.19328 type:complete len:204 (+) Transcript_9815:1179-1790(+)
MLPVQQRRLLMRYGFSLSRNQNAYVVGVSLHYEHLGLAVPLKPHPPVVQHRRPQATAHCSPTPARVVAIYLDYLPTAVLNVQGSDFCNVIPAIFCEGVASAPYHDEVLCHQGSCVGVPSYRGLSYWRQQCPSEQSVSVSFEPLDPQHVDVVLDLTIAVYASEHVDPAVLVVDELILGVGNVEDVEVALSADCDWVDSCHCEVS